MAGDGQSTYTKYEKILYLGLEIAMGRTSSLKNWFLMGALRGLLFDDMSCFDWSFYHAPGLFDRFH